VLTQLINMPRDQWFVVACSGGSDSMAVADFYKRGNKQFIVAYYNHATEQADEMEACVSDWARANKVIFARDKLSIARPKGISPEEHWRNERYKWLNSLGLPIITAHHLSDVVETWVFGCAHGNPKLIPKRNGNVLRPFLLNAKSHLTKWCVDHKVKWIEDRSNNDLNSPRNRIRHVIIPELMKVNPGLMTTVRNKLIDRERQEMLDRQTKEKVDAQ